MKKLLALILIVGMFSLFIVSAAGVAGGVGDAVRSFSSVLTHLSGKLLGDVSSISNAGISISAETILFARLLLVLILIAIVWAILNQVNFFSERTWVLAIISIGVSILAIRFLNSQLIATILIPYTTLGFVVGAGIPFLIFFFLVNVGLKGSPPMVRKVAWVFFAVVFVFLWLNFSETTNKFKYVYPIVALLCIIMMFIDGTIQRFFAQMDIERSLQIFDQTEYYRRKKENDKLYEDYTTLSSTGNKEDAKKAERILKLIQENEKNMARLAAGVPDKSK